MSSVVSIKRAALISAGSKYVSVFLGVAFSAVLSRILSPDDYGIAAVVSVFTAFFAVLSNCGLGIAVIQKKDFTQKDIDSLFSFSVILGAALSLLFCLAAWPVSLFYGESVYVPLCLILSVPVFFNTVNAVPDGLLRRERRFLLIGVRLIAVSLLTYGVTVVLALLNFRYYALVIQSAVNSLLIFLWNMGSVRVHFTLKIDRSVLRRIAGYSGYDFLFNVVNYFSRNLDKLLVGRILGNGDLAQYGRACHFMLYPVQNLTNIVSPVLHPVLSDCQSDRLYIYGQYVRVVKILSLMGVLITPVCFCCGREIILILYGGQWSAATDCFRYLSLAVWTQMIGGTAGAMFAALGDTRRLFCSSLANTGVVIGSLLAALRFRSVIAVSAFVCAALVIHFFITFFTLIRLTMRLSFPGFLKIFLCDFLMIAVLLAASAFLNAFPCRAGRNLSASLCAKGGILLAVYGLLLAAFRQGRYFLPVLPAGFRRRIARSAAAARKKPHGTKCGGRTG